MSAPFVPSPLDCVGRRRFAFHPPIRHLDSNEWMTGTASWSEVQVVNPHTGLELWMSRRYIGAISENASPLLLVRLTEPLDFHGGALEPRGKRVIEMPTFPEESTSFSNPFEHGRRPPGPAQVVAIRLEPRADSPINRALFTTCIGALVIALLAALLGAARV